jgi:hypothetical protein
MTADEAARILENEGMTAQTPGWSDVLLSGLAPNLPEWIALRWILLQLTGLQSMHP